MFLCLKISPHLLYLFRRMLQHYLAVKLQRCFVNYEASPDPLLAWGCVVCVLTASARGSSLTCGPLLHVIPPLPHLKSCHISSCLAKMCLSIRVISVRQHWVDKVFDALNTLKDFK